MEFPTIDKFAKDVAEKALLKDKTPFCPICGEDLRGENNE